MVFPFGGRRFCFLFIVTVCGLVGAFDSAEAAALDPKALKVVAKTFDFLVPKPQSQAKVVVVGGAVDLTLARASLANLSIAEGKSSDSAGAFAVFVSTPEEALAARAANAHVLTIGGDVSCVTSGACLMAVEMQPKVTIYVSRAVAQASSVDFDPNFRMLITEK